MNSAGALIHGAYDKPLVVLSVLIAILAAGAAIDLAGRVTSSRGTSRFVWLTGGAFAMGVGIWSMHYIGMLAYQLPVPVQYDWPIVLLSLFAAMCASWISLFVVSRETLQGRHVVAGSVLMGCGIAAMHYIGMEAMRLPAMHHYSAPLVGLSIALAIVIAYVALRLTFSLRTTVLWGWRKMAAALTMGAAIPVMHYVGMAAVTFTAMPHVTLDLSHAVAISELGVVSITLVTVLILGLVFLSATVDRRFALQAGQLHSSELRYQEIVETASDAFLEIASDGSIRGWNAHAEALFGWTRAEALATKFDDLISGEAANQALRMLFDRDGGMKQQRLEATGRARNGRTFPAEMTLSAIDSGGSRAVAAFVHDVSQRKLADAEREQAKLDAEAGSRAKSEFLANMSHEIRTPLNGVIGMSELLLDTPLSTVQRDYAETIRGSSMALLAIINDILDFSKVEAGKLELDYIDMSLRHTVEEVARLLAVPAHAKGLELTVHVDPQLPSLVSGDAGRLRQVLLNLGGNAIKFTQQGEIAIELQRLDTDAGRIKVRCEVRDTGIGIPEERQQALFSPFTQADTSTTRRFGGTGLGLSIVRRLVQLMHGETGVTSIVGEGSTFWFTAEFGVASTQVAAASAPFVSLQGRRVLVVDDNATNRNVLREQLRACGVEPQLTQSAAQGWDALVAASEAGQAFDVIIIDHEMPGEDGSALGRRIVATSAVSAVRMILLTSSGHAGDGKRFAEIGFAGYLVKPVTQQDLTRALTLALSASAHEWHLQSQPLITQQVIHAQAAQTSNRLLLAEDNAVNQKVAARMLEKLGYEVDVVANGRAAVDAWQSGEYDLILMDCQMPEMDGFEASREIRRLEAAPSDAERIPIIALTADALKGTDAECFAAGMTGYLTKPIDRALLASMLSSALAAPRGHGTVTAQ